MSDERPGPKHPAGILIWKTLERHTWDTYCGGGEGVWPDPDGGMLRVCEAIRQLLVEIEAWDSTPYKPFSYHVRKVLNDALEVPYGG